MCRDKRLVVGDHNTLAQAAGYCSISVHPRNCYMDLTGAAANLLTPEVGEGIEVLSDGSLFVAGDDNFGLL